MLGIVGSRSFHNYDFLKEKVNDFINEIDEEITTIVSGGASGVDRLAEKFAKENNLKLMVFHAEWEKYGRGAGPIRNIKIVENSDYIIAFPSKNGRGTQDTIKKAEKKKKIVKIYWTD